VARLRLHLDADASQIKLQQALMQRGHDVTRTPTDWMPLDASDTEQLLGASAQGRCLFTCNVRDFVALGGKYGAHHGIVLAAQSSWTLSTLIAALDKILRESEDADWIGQVRWLNQWR
jgi:hypothetical protein